MTKYKNTIILLIASLGIFFFAESSFAATYYVDSTCSINGDGTTQTCGAHGPFNSLANAQSAIRGNQSDNSLLFNAGQTFHGQFVVDAYGTTGHPFVISSYGSGNKPVINGGGASSVISITNLSNITISGLEITGGTICINIYRSSTGSPTNALNINNNYMHGCDGTGINYNNDYSIGNNRPDLSNSSWDHNEITGACAAIYLHRANGAVISYNYLHDNGNAYYEPYAIAGESTSYLDIHDNLINTTMSNAIQLYGDYDPFDGPSSYNKIYRNIISGTWKGGTTPAMDISLAGFTGTQNSVYYNILLSNDPTVVHFWEDSTTNSGNVFYANTLANGDTGIRTFGGTWLVKNNIFSSMNTGTFTTTNLTFSNNIAYSAGTIPAAITSNPRFVDTSSWYGYRLQTGSPAIDAGENLGTAYQDAFDPNSTTWPASTVNQNNYGSGWEIGAFVFKGSPSDTTPPAAPKGLRVR